MDAFFVNELIASVFVAGIAISFIMLGISENTGSI